MASGAAEGTDGNNREIDPGNLDNFSGLVLLAHEFAHSVQYDVASDVAVVFGALYLARSATVYRREVMLNILSLKPAYVVGVLWLLLSIGLFKSCNRTPPEYEAFFTQDWDTQREQAKGFPIDKQIEYCLAGRKYVHPPSIIVFHVIADRGKEAVPPVIERMKRAEDDNDKLELMDLVLNIHEFHDDLSHDKQVIDQLTAIVAGITDPDRKVKAEAMLADIKRPPERTNN